MADIKDFSPSLQFSVMNSLRTGNVVIDTILGLMIPTILGCVYAWFGKVKTAVQKYFGSKAVVLAPRNFQRTITYDSYSSNGDILNNFLLQRAIKMYISDQLGLHTAPNGNIFIKALRDSNTSTISAKYVNEFKIYTAPSDNDTTVLENGIMIRITESVKENSRTGNMIGTITNMVLECTSADGGAHTISQFVNDSMMWLQKQLKANEDHSRYMYNPSINDTISVDERDSTQYRRYKLHDTKTFASLFFSQKASLMQLLTHFQNKTGRYAISGSPFKLGLLLHGPPGIAHWF